VWSLIPAGYFLGRTVPQIIDYIEYFIIGFIVITTIPLVVSYIKIRRDGKKEAG
jgi:membrane-associated protein